MKKQLLSLLLIASNSLWAGCTASKPLNSASELVNYTTLRKMKSSRKFKEVYIINPETNLRSRKIPLLELEHILKSLEGAGQLRGIELDTHGILEIFLK